MSLEITHFYSGYRSGSLFILSISHNTPTPTFYNSTVAASLSVFQFSPAQLAKLLKWSKIN